MPKISYIDRAFAPGTQAIIDRANVILAEYEAQGFDLTLRQLFYQFVARGWIANREREYKRLGSIINDARLAGLIDWDRISDRTRELEEKPYWAGPRDVIASAARQFRTDVWANQPCRPEVWIEKDALTGVIAGVCEELAVPYFSCRGYVSQSSMWANAQRLAGYHANGQDAIVLHLGDHDPSGIDMTRDIQARLDLFVGNVEVRRLGLSMDQVRQYGPPPNPAKITDSRFAGYLAEYGRESWELDALQPQVIAALIRDAVQGDLIDEADWRQAQADQERGRGLLQRTARHWGDVADLIDVLDGEGGQDG